MFRSGEGMNRGQDGHDASAGTNALHRAIRLATLLSVLSSVPAHGADTGTIVGRVTDERGAPYQWAGIMLVGTQWGAFSGEGGSYRIPSLPPGDYRLRASMLLSADDSATVHLLPGAVDTVNFRLPPRLLATFTAWSGPGPRRADLENGIPVTMRELSGYALALMCFDPDHETDLRFDSPQVRFMCALTDSIAARIPELGRAFVAGTTLEDFQMLCGGCGSTDPDWKKTNRAFDDVAGRVRPKVIARETYGIPVPPPPRWIWNLSESRRGSPGSALADLGLAQIMLDKEKAAKLEVRFYYVCVGSGDLRDMTCVRRRMGEIPRLSEFAGRLLPGYQPMRTATPASEVCADSSGMGDPCGRPVRLRYVRRTRSGRPDPHSGFRYDEQHYWRIEARCDSWEEADGILGLRLSVVEGDEPVTTGCAPTER
jgi:hypothetical protein